MYTMYIDFDKASTMWRKNKLYIGNGMFKYVCCAITKKGNVCRIKPRKNEKFCYIHAK